ncbi:MAG: MGMT family protein [Bryobacteraceae bacterium]|nr:MGMT family protein [Bryobacteraceae bacterium]MDW8376808.1 MGMT family protein [Bryobacterales bacterium]
MRHQPPAKLQLRILKDVQRDVAGRQERIQQVIRSIPPGKVASYGQVAAAAGYPLYHRLVVRILRNSGDALPWHRVLGAGGVIKLKGTAAYEQRLRLELEGVRFQGKRVDLTAHQHHFRIWELDEVPLP